MALGAIFAVDWQVGFLDLNVNSYGDRPARPPTPYPAE